MSKQVAATHLICTLHGQSKQHLMKIAVVKVAINSLSLPGVFFLHQTDNIAAVEIMSLSFSDLR